MNILFVDDSKLTRAVLGHALRHKRHEVFTAESVAEARTFLESNAVDLLITDLNMPEETGLDLARWVRAHGNLSAIPVLLLTADFEPASLEIAREAGVNLFIEKTFCADELADAIDKALQEIDTPGDKGEGNDS